jgi:hypothetical protein
MPRCGREHGSELVHAAFFGHPFEEIEDEYSNSSSAFPLRRGEAPGWFNPSGFPKS